MEAGLGSAVFIDLVSSLCSELKTLNQMQENVSKPSGAVQPVGVCCTSYNHCFCTGVEDTDSFQMEMRGFLQELSCPHKHLTSDLNILASYSSRLLLIGQHGD